MTRTPLDVIRLNSEAFSRRDVDAMLALYAPDAVVTDRRAVGFGTFRGHEALRSYYSGMFDNADELREVVDVLSLDDVAGGSSAVVSCRLHARLAGSDDPAVFDYALRIAFDSDGLIATIDLYEDAAAASAAAAAG